MKDIVAPLYALLLVYACKHLQELVLSTTASDGVGNTPDECSITSEVFIIFDLLIFLTYFDPYFTLIYFSEYSSFHTLFFVSYL